MAANAEEPHGGTAPPVGGWQPVPDPTRLTTEQLRRELATLREIIETRLRGMDRATELVSAQSAVLREEIEQIRNRLRAETAAEIGQLRELLETRLDGMDRATEVTSTQSAVNRERIENTRAQLHRETATQVAQLRELLEARFDGMDRAIRLHAEIIDRVPTERDMAIKHLEELHDEKFGSIALQFAERDVRSEQASDGAKQALDAALLAQKELVAQQNEANSAAAAKAEASFTKQIDQIGTIIQTLEKALDARITELKERIDRGEGSTAGAAGSRSDRRLDTGQVLTTLSVLAAVIGLLILAFRH